MGLLAAWFPMFALVFVAIVYLMPPPVATLTWVLVSAASAIVARAAVLALERVTYNFLPVRAGDA